MQILLVRYKSIKNKEWITTLYFTLPESKFLCMVQNFMLMKVVQHCLSMTYLQVIASLPLSNRGGVPERSGRLITATPRLPTSARQLPLLFLINRSTSHTGGRERANVCGDKVKWTKIVMKHILNYGHIIQTPYQLPANTNNFPNSLKPFL